MTVKTQGINMGEHIVSLFNGAAQNGGDISLEQGRYDNGHGVVKDGTVLKLVGGKLVPATGTTDTAGDSNEEIVGTAYGTYNTADAEVEGAYVARLAVVNVDSLTYSGSLSAIVAALAKLFIIAR